jgi:hypothetical protein
MRLLRDETTELQSVNHNLSQKLVEPVEFLTTWYPAIKSGYDSAQDHHLIQFNIYMINGRIETERQTQKLVEPVSF